MLFHCLYELSRMCNQPVLVHVRLLESLPRLEHDGIATKDAERFLKECIVFFIANLEVVEMASEFSRWIRT